MKRKLLNKSFLKQTALAVPAAALMLGAAQAGTTIGLNFQAWYYDSGTTPQTIGFNNGYSDYATTGFPVTAKAFGVDVTNWFNTDPIGPATSIDTDCTFGGTATTFAGGLSCHVTSPKGTYFSGAGELNPLNPAPPNGTNTSNTQGACPPGDDEVFWAYIAGDDASPFTVSVTGLAAKFPNGYAIESMAALGANGGQKFPLLPSVDFTDGTTTDTSAYSIYYVQNNPKAQWTVSTVGISDPSGMFTADTISINSRSDGTGVNSSLCGFIVTDQPVVTHSVPASTVVKQGGSFVLSASVVGINTLSYQWQHAGTNIPGATFVSYTNTSAAIADSGNYQLIATGSLFPSSPSTGAVLVVTVVPPHAPRSATWDANAETSGAQDGSGTWSYALVNWWSGSFDDYWNDTDSAVFGVGGAGPYTVTLGDNITANAITFNTGGYTITNSSGQTLTLQTNGTITANGAATIGTPLSTGTNVFLKAGTGALRVSGALECGQTFVSAGSLEVLAKNGDSPYTVTNGTTLKIGYSTGGGYANSAMKIYGDGVAATTGLYLLGGTTYNVSGGVVVYNAPTTIRQYGNGLASFGMFDINGTPGLSITAAASGSVLDSNIQTVSDGYGMVLTTVAGANTATGDLIINGPLNVGSLGLLKEGAGSVRLNAVAASHNTAVNVMGGSVICGTDNCVGANATLNVGSLAVSSVHPAPGTVFNLNGFNQTVTNASLAGTVKMTIKTGGTPSGTVLTTTDVGNPLAYDGTLTVTSIGTAPTIGQKFTLFNSAGGYTGAFTNFNLPPFDRLAWDTSQLLVDGSITVTAGSVPPTITTDLPTGTSYAYIGATINLSVVASGDPLLHYNWKRGTTPVGTDSPTLTLTSVTTSDTGDYSVTVTNPWGTSPPSTTHHLEVVVPGTYAAAVMQDVPLAYWPLGESEAATAYDYSAGHDGTQNGGLTLGVAGPRPPTYAGFSATNTAYQFDGASSFVDCGTGPALSGTTDFTLEAWVNTASTADGMILQQRYSGGYNGEYMFSVNADGTLSLTVYGGGAYQFNNLNSLASGKLVNDGNWHHVAAVRSGANGAIYIDGALTGTATGPLAPLDPTFTVAIGEDARDSTSYFNGLMCNVAIYSTALSAAAVQTHYIVGQNGAVVPQFNPPVLSNGQLTITWTGTGTLLQSTNVTLPMSQWTIVPGNPPSPYQVIPATAGPRIFYRLQQ